MDETEARPFGVWTAAALVVGAVIGAGIFIMPSQLASYGWTGVVAWIVGGGGALVIALVLAAIARARPQEPGLIAVIGEVLGPVFGVLNGWGAWMSYCCGNAYISLTAVRYASQFWPPLGATSFNQALAASAIIASLSWLNLCGLRAAGKFQVVTTVLKLLPLAAVLGILAWLVGSDPGAYASNPHEPFSGTDLFPAAALAFVAIMGFESASLAAERVRNPERNVPRSTIMGVLLCCLIYLAVCSGIVFALPEAEVTASNAPIAMFIARFWGDWAGLAVAGFAVISAVGGLNVWVMLQGEVPLGLARAGLLPRAVGWTNRHDVAAVPLLAGSGVTILLLLSSSWRDGAALMDFMLKLTSASGLWIYVFACISALVLRVRVVVAALGLIFSLALLYGSGMEAVLLSIALMLAALPFYWLARRAITPAATAG